MGNSPLAGRQMYTWITNLSMQMWESYNKIKKGGRVKLEEKAVKWISIMNKCGWTESMHWGMVIHSTPLHYVLFFLTQKSLGTCTSTSFIASWLLESAFSSFLCFLSSVQLTEKVADFRPLVLLTLSYLEVFSFLLPFPGQLIDQYI